MDITIQMIIYFAFVAMSVVLIAYSLLKCRKRRLTRSMVIMLTMMLAWQVILIAQLFATDVQLERLLRDLKLPFIALTMVSLLIFIMRFYGMDAYVTRYIIFILSVVPAFTIVLALTTNSHGYLRDYVAVFTPEFHFQEVLGLWYWLHTAFCYFITALTLTIVIVQHNKTPRTFRSTSWLVVVSMMITVVLNLIYITDLFMPPVDPTFLAMSIMEPVLFILTINNNSIELLRRARNDIFNQLTNALFILDTESGIISRNPAAKEFLHVLGVQEDERSFETLLGVLDSQASKISGFSDEEDGTDYHITFFGKSLVLNKIERTIRDNMQKELGALVVFTDVTDNRALIDKLEKKAGRDTLTGLYNRRRVDELRFAMDTPESLPLTVLVGDLNGLKAINDTLGHRMGDMFIRLAANTLLTRCPPNALVARTGGDEFLALIPNCPMQNAAELVSDIKNRMQKRNYFQFEPSIALGFSVKNNAQQNLDDLITIADRSMYADKALSARE